MPTARSETLRSLAERVAERLPPLVTEAVLTGSTSRGEADELSDVEFLVAVPALPSPAECAAAAAAADVEPGWKRLAEPLGETATR